MGLNLREKALIRTLSGKDTREGLPLAESGPGRNRNSYRLGAAHRYVGWDGTSRYRGHERRPAGRKQGGTVEYAFVSHP